MASTKQPPKGTGELLKGDRQKLWKGSWGGVLWAGSARHELDPGNSNGLLTSSLLNIKLPLSFQQQKFYCWLCGGIKKWNSFFRTGNPSTRVQQVRTKVDMSSAEEMDPLPSADWDIQWQLLHVLKIQKENNVALSYCLLIIPTRNPSQLFVSNMNKENLQEERRCWK